MSGLLLLPGLDFPNPVQNRIDTVEQLPESADLEVLRPRRQEHELTGDGPHERVEEGLGRLLHIPATPLNPPADNIPEAVGVPHGGHNNVVILHQISQEDLDLGHRAPQQVGVDAPLLAPAPSDRDLALQARGDLPAKGVDRLITPPPESGDVAPARTHILDHRRHATGRRSRNHVRDPQQKFGQTKTEPS